MSTYSLLVDHKMCFDCKACEVACKQTNKLPEGTRWINVVTVGPKKIGQKIITNYIPTMCRHCAKPPCIDSCPMDAITKRSDGIVTIDEAVCNGCTACISACPFAVPQYDPVKNVVSKCTMCLDRVQRGMKPACVDACPAGAIYFGEINEIISQLQGQLISSFHREQ